MYLLNNLESTGYYFYQQKLIALIVQSIYLLINNNR